MARRFRSQIGSQKRQVTWVGPAAQGAVNVASTGATLLSFFSPSDAGLTKATVVRTRGAVTISPQVFSADVIIHGAYGEGIVSDQAFAAGISSVPEPFTEADWDGWFVWRSFTLELAVADATGKILPAQLTFEVDSKAMRKVGDGETLITVAESFLGAFKISSHTRTLFKLA